MGHFPDKSRRRELLIGDRDGAVGVFIGVSEIAGDPVSQLRRAERDVAVGVVTLEKAALGVFFFQDGYRAIMRDIYYDETGHVPREYRLPSQVVGSQEGSITVYEGDIGYNLVSFSDATSGVEVSLDIAGQQNSGGAGLVELWAVEGVEGTAYADTLIGNAFGNTFNGGAGNDFIDGGAGFDWVDYLNAGGGVTIDLNQTLQAAGASGRDTLLNIEAVRGSGSSDVIRGNAEANTLIGGGGSDDLYGGDGDDLLIGHGPLAGRLADEDDHLDGGAGFDRVAVDPALLWSDNGYVDVWIDLNQGSLFSRTYEVRTTLVSIEGAAEGHGDDYIMGSAADNELVGRNGVDEIHGAGGDDYIDGGGHGDLLDGGAGFDTLSYLSSQSGVVISLAAGAGEGDVFSGFEALMGSQHADDLTGDGAANHLFGAGGADELSGGGGDDLIVGGSGQDTMRGGTGADTFRFSDQDLEWTDEIDRVLDLGSGDTLDFSRIDANIDVSGDQAFSLVSALNGNAGQATRTFDAAANETVISFDVDGDAQADFFLTLTGNHTSFAGIIW